MAKTKAVRLGVKDLKILQLLDKNARLQFSQIAELVDLPESVVRYRLKRMEKTGIIKGYLAFIDSRKLGYKFHNIYVKLKVMSEEKERELVDRIKKVSSVCWFVSTAGQYNFIISVLAKDNHHVEKIYNELMKVLENNIVEDAMFMTTDAYQMPYPLFENTAVDTYVSIGKDSKEHDLDSVDLKIMQELAMNCRISNLELSRKLKLNIHQVTERVDSLLESDLIQGFKPLIDMSKLGKVWYMLLFKLKYVDEIEKKKFVERMKLFPETFFIVNGIGNFGMQVEFFADNHSKFREVLNKIFPSENSEIVKDYTELKITKEHKCFFFPVELTEEVQVNSKVWFKVGRHRRLENQKKLEKFV